MTESAAVRAVWSELGLLGLVDVHTHFMPTRVMDKVWQYFDAAGQLGSKPWPITYRTDEATRLTTLRNFGVRAFTSLVYPHKPDMAVWLNQWAAQFAADTPDCLSTATFFPEPGAADYVRAAVEGGVQVFKAHVQVGGYDPNDALLHPVWAILEDAGTPIVIHCGSGPQPGGHTGPDQIRALLSRYPRLRLVIAHLGMPEYTEFLDLCEQYDEVRLDTTMAFTPFIEESMPFPRSALRRLYAVGDRVLFGSDFPNIPYGYLKAMIVLTQLEGVDDAWLRGVSHDNAARLLGVPVSRRQR